LSCPICHKRKEKRFCLALHDRICPQCCGEQREVTLDCPSECEYLQQARQHEKPRELSDAERTELFPKVEIRADFLERYEPFIGGLMQTLLGAAQGDRNLKDGSVLGALSAMATSYQTLVASGLVYQEATPNPSQAAIIETLQRAIEEFRKLEQQHLGYTALRDSDVLKALVFIIRLGHVHTSGRPLSRAFLDYLRAQFPEPPPDPESRVRRAGLSCRRAAMKRRKSIKN
jgi:hypothetical protein